MFLFKNKKQEQGHRRGTAASPDRLVTVRVEVPGHVGREYVLQASVLEHQRLAPLMAEAEAEYGVQQGDVIRVPSRPCHFVEAMVWAAVEEAMQGGKAHGAAVVPVVGDSGTDSGDRHDLGRYLRPVRLAYQPASQQYFPLQHQSANQSGNGIFSHSISTSHHQPAKQTGHARPHPVVDIDTDCGNRHDLGWYLARPH